MTDSRVVMVTGAARRIGTSLARMMHSCGYRILIHYHQSIKEARELCAGLNASRPDSAAIVHADLCRMDEIRHMARDALEKWGRLDALINNASAFYPTPLTSASEEEWDELMGSNLKGHYFLCQAVADELRRRHGAIVNIADIYAYQPLADHSIYCIAKSGILMLTRTLARELAPEVRVNSIAPGAILWPETTDGISPLNTKGILEKIPLNRLGGPEDIAQLASFLLTKGSYITGQTIAVDGGRSA